MVVKVQCIGFVTNTHLITPRAFKQFAPTLLGEYNEIKKN